MPIGCGRAHSRPARRLRKGEARCSFLRNERQRRPDQRLLEIAMVIGAGTGRPTLLAPAHVTSLYMTRNGASNSRGRRTEKRRQTDESAFSSVVGRLSSVAVPLHAGTFGRMSRFEVDQCGAQPRRLFGRGFAASREEIMDPTRNARTAAWQTKILWAGIALIGAISFAIVALNRGAAVNAAWPVRA